MPKQFHNISQKHKRSQPPSDDLESQTKKLKNRKYGNPPSQNNGKQRTSVDDTTLSSEFHIHRADCHRAIQVLEGFFSGCKPEFPDLELESLGTLVRKSQCPLYRFIINITHQWLKENGIPRTPQYTIKLEQSYDSLGNAHPSRLLLNVGDLCDYPPAGPELHIVSLQSSLPASPCGRLIDPHWIDVSLVRTWIDNCDSWHSGHCHSLDREAIVPWPSNIRLIDVNRGCLVRVSSPQKYVALSYVWGRVNDRARKFQTTEANVYEYEQEGSLTGAKLRTSIPRTVKDAIQLVRTLGLPYLWVDSFCIIQDNAESIRSQINQMNSIFANSYFTIIASDGDNADFGLRGIDREGESRDVRQETFEYARGRSLLAPTTNMFEYDLWNKRGWTFQEKLFSRRKLIFSNGIARWMCHCIEWTEDIAAESTAVTGPGHCENLSEVGSFTLRNDPDATFTEYSQLVNEYGETELTHGADVLSAFSGIMSSLSRSFVGGFHYGLPEMFFSLAVLWQPASAVTRRVERDGFGAGFPSWSWAGWKGARGYAQLGWSMGCAKVTDDESSWDLTSEVTWHKVAMDGTKSKINDSWQEYRHSCSSTSKPLPLGWSRHVTKRGKKYSSTSYSHVSHTTTRYRFPIPIQDPESNPISLNPLLLWSPRLFLNTTLSRSHLKTGSKCLPNTIHPDQCLPVSLFTIDEEWAGILHLNLPSSQRAPPSFSVDLIFLSYGSARNNNDESFYLAEWDFEGRPKDGVWYEFCNVMWVEWEDRVAYRRGIGRIEKRVWDSLETEETAVLLG